VRLRLLHSVAETLSALLLMQEWQDSQFLERADSGAIAAVHDAALVHILVGWVVDLVHILVGRSRFGAHIVKCSTFLAGKGWQDNYTQNILMPSNIACYAWSE